MIAIVEMIKQFGMSIWEWFLSNQESITAFFMSGQAVSFVAALIMLIKNLKGTRANTASTEKLDMTLVNTNNMSDSIVSLESNFLLLKQENDCLRTELKETETQLQNVNQDIVSKLNAIIEVQSIVYSTIRDDGVRQTVNTILNNARYSEKNFKESLETQIEELKQAYKFELQNVNDKMTKSMDEVKNTLNMAKNAEVTMRKRTDNIQRY